MFMTETSPYTHVSCCELLAYFDKITEQMLLGPGEDAGVLPIFECRPYPPTVRTSKLTYILSEAWVLL